MKIKTQFIISIVFFTVMLIALSVGLLALNVRLARHNRQEDIISDIERSARDLGYIANNYLLYGEPQQPARWEATFNAITASLSEFRELSAADQVDVANIQDNLTAMQRVFSDIRSTIERNSSSTGEFFDQSFIQVSWSRLEVQNQGVIFDASRLFQVVDDRLDRTRQQVTALLFILVAIFAIYLFLTFLLLFRRTLKSITLLQSGTQIVGSGNLDYTLPEKGKDEIGDLSRSFNSMTTNLKTVTASKTELEREIAARKETEEELVTMNETLQEQASELESEIDERKKAEQAIVQEKERAQQLLNIAGVIIMEMDLEGIVTLINARGCEILGYKAEEIIGQNWFSTFVPERIRPQSMAAHLALKTNTRGWIEYLENPILNRQGEERMIAWHNSLVRDQPGHLIGMLSSGDDITERKKAAQDLQKYARELETANKELESFNYSVSHDLRQPLRALESFSEILSEGYRDKLDESGRNYLERIIKASQFMSQLTDDILKLSRVTRVDLYRDSVNLSNVAFSIMEDLLANQPERHPVIKIAPDIMVSGDKALMEIALRNLLENAWKFTGKVARAYIEMGEMVKDGERVYFIRDNGCGFDMRYKDKLFRPFERLHSDKEYPGTGIGLAIVERIIHRHGGRIWAESETGKGATFFFTLGA
jgi:PAS domain S-box-containing protein